MFASTFEKNFGAILKHSHLRLYMPMWTLEELKSGAVCYPSISHDEITDLYLKWEGSPRCIFVTKNDCGRKLDIFLRSQALDEVITDMEQVAMSVHPRDTNQWLVHMFVVEGSRFQQMYQCWPSQYVLEKVCSASEERRQYEKMRYRTSVMHGQIYENSVI